MTDAVWAVVAAGSVVIVLHVITGLIEFRTPRRHAWCACGDSRVTGQHSAAECGPPEWRF